VVSFATGSASLIVCCLQLSGSDVARKLIMMAQVVAKSTPEQFLLYTPDDPTSFSEVSSENNRVQASLAWLGNVIVAPFSMPAMGHGLFISCAVRCSCTTS
jgi:hypothetical protein